MKNHDLHLFRIYIFSSLNKFLYKRIKSGYGDKFKIPTFLTGNLIFRGRTYGVEVIL